MTYIKLEDVLRNIKWHNADWILEHLIEDINSLQSINPEAMIEEMIETRNDCNDDFQIWFDFALVTILQKFKS